MLQLKVFFKRKIQKLVDATNGKPIDIVVTIGYIIITVFSAIILFRLYQLVKMPILTTYFPNWLYTFFILLPTGLFHLSLAGKYYKKPSRRIIQFVFLIVSTMVIALGYISQLSNQSLVSWIVSIRGIDKIPYSLLEGNIRLVTFMIPAICVIPSALLMIKFLFDDVVKKELREYEVEVLLPSVHKMDDTTIDLKICEDYVTGEDCIVPEKINYEHTILQGGTGSGKTATYIRPILAQLFKKKAYLREKQKEIAYQCLKDGIAYITAPITNKYLNENFSMSYIQPKEGKREEFIKRFEHYIIGIRDNSKNVLSEESKGGNYHIPKPKSDDVVLIKIAINKAGMVIAEKEVKYTFEKRVNNIEIDKRFEPIKIAEDEVSENAVHISSIEDDSYEYMTLICPMLTGEYSYNISVEIKGSGKIIYKDLGVIVVSPDGELAKDTVKMAKEFSVFVNKLDPSLEEINKGVVKKFNPLIGNHPEKKGDIISSILATMEQGEGEKGSASYFVNASVRAVRNVIIILKVMYPKMYKREPVLDDILEILNDFNLIVPVVEEMKKDGVLAGKYKNVISYFETSFYPPEVNDQGKVIVGRSVGSKRQQTQEAIGGIINQLDNFLGRDEIKYILCPEDDRQSMNLANVLENGECMAISTRQSDLGSRLGKAFALFFILSIQNEVLSRYSENENPEVPVFIFIDEFPFYINDMTKVFFTFARKYKCAITIAIQNMGQLEEISKQFRQTIFTNTSIKMLLPKSNVEDREYWCKYFGAYEKFEMQTGVTTNSVMADNPTYSEQRRGTVVEKQFIPEQEIFDMNFQDAFYVYTNAKGRQVVGKGRTDFVKIDKNNKVELKYFSFEDFTLKPSNSTSTEQNMEDKNIGFSDIQIDDAEKRLREEILRDKEEKSGITDNNEEFENIVIDVQGLEESNLTEENTESNYRVNIEESKGNKNNIEEESNVKEEISILISEQDLTEDDISNMVIDFEEVAVVIEDNNAKIHEYQDDNEKSKEISFEDGQIIDIEINEEI